MGLSVLVIFVLLGASVSGYLLHKNNQLKKQADSNSRQIGMLQSDLNRSNNSSNTDYQQLKTDYQQLKTAIINDPAHDADMNRIIDMIDMNSPPVLAPIGSKCVPGKNVLSNTTFPSYQSIANPTPEQKKQQQAWSDCYDLAKSLFVTEYVDNYGQQN